MRRLAVLALPIVLAACLDALGPSNPYAGRSVTTPRPAASGQPLAAVSAGFFHSCALTPAGAALCWGSDEYAQLGTLEPVPACELRPCTARAVAVQGGHRFRSIGAAFSHTCALAEDGGAWCWGAGEADPGGTALGDGGTARSAAPVRARLDSALVQLSVGARVTCGLTASGVAYCWGRNADGEVGDSTTTSRLVPTRVAQGALRFRRIGAGDGHVCAITVEGRLYCWGGNRWGQLGLGEVPYNAFGFKRAYPGAVWADSTFLDVAAGGTHSCALTTAGRAYCWGQNENARQLGDRSPVSHRGVPGAVAAGPAAPYESLSAGEVSTCAVTAAGESWCWGSDYFGALGDGRTAPGGVDHPVRTRGGPYRAVSVGGSHACGLKRDGTAACWGDRFFGQLGDR